MQYPAVASGVGRHGASDGIEILRGGVYGLWLACDVDRCGTIGALAGSEP